MTIHNYFYIHFPAIPYNYKPIGLIDFPMHYRHLSSVYRQQIARKVVRNIAVVDVLDTTIATL